MSLKAWLARLSFSFFILAMALAWTWYPTLSGRDPNASLAQTTLYWLTIAACVVLGLLGVRERHRGE